jgi:hypothetical protein
MEVQAVLANKDLRAKAKAEAICRLLLGGDVSFEAVIDSAKAAKGSERATCIEAIEFATKSDPQAASLDCLDFVTDSLLDKAPRVKWESARVIANIAHLYPDKLDKAISNLLTNSEYSGTVVRWSAALALGEIVKLKNKRHEDLNPAIEAILRREQDNAIKKIYQSALNQAESN